MHCKIISGRKTEKPIEFVSFFVFCFFYFFYIIRNMDIHLQAQLHYCNYEWHYHHYYCNEEEVQETFQRMLKRGRAAKSMSKMASTQSLCRQFNRTIHDLHDKNIFEVEKMIRSKEFDRLVGRTGNRILAKISSFTGVHARPIANTRILISAIVMNLRDWYRIYMPQEVVDLANVVSVNTLLLAEFLEHNANLADLYPLDACKLYPKRLRMFSDAMAGWLAKYESDVTGKVRMVLDLLASSTDVMDPESLWRTKCCALRLAKQWNITELPETLRGGCESYKGHLLVDKMELAHELNLDPGFRFTSLNVAGEAKEDLLAVARSELLQKPPSFAHTIKLLTRTRNMLCIECIDEKELESAEEIRLVMDIEGVKKDAAEGSITAASAAAYFDRVLGVLRDVFEIDIPGMQAFSNCIDNVDEALRVMREIFDVTSRNKINTGNRKLDNIRQLFEEGHGIPFERNMFNDMVQSEAITLRNTKKWFRMLSSKATRPADQDQFKKIFQALSCEILLSEDKFPETFFLDTRRIKSLRKTIKTVADAAVAMLIVQQDPNLSNILPKKKVYNLINYVSRNAGTRIKIIFEVDILQQAASQLPQDGLRRRHVLARIRSHLLFHMIHHTHLPWNHHPLAYFEDLLCPVIEEWAKVVDLNLVVHKKTYEQLPCAWSAEATSLDKLLWYDDHHVAYMRYERGMILFARGRAYSMDPIDPFPFYDPGDLYASRVLLALIVAFFLFQTTCSWAWTLASRACTRRTARSSAT